MFEFASLVFEFSLLYLGYAIDRPKHKKINRTPMLTRTFKCDEKLNSRFALEHRWGNLGDTACYRDCSVCTISSAESCNWFETRLNIENEINLGPASSRSECVQMVRSVSFLLHLLRVLIRITHITLATFSYPPLAIISIERFYFF